VKNIEHAAALRRSAVAIAVAGCLVSGAAIAQDRELEEIVVTAERRVNTEATTAISVEVLTDAFIAENQIKDIIDLQNAVPSLQFFQNGSYVQANIRGVGNPSTGGPSEQVGVPVFFDGATQGEEMGIASGFFDLAGIEVLRGPQATFVGQAAAGGAILINSARPNFDGLNGFLELTTGTYGQRKLMGALNLPIAENFAARVAYMSEVRDSYYDNATGGQVPGASSQWTPGDQQDQNFRLSLLWEPSDKLSVWSKFEQSELHTYGAPLQPNPRFYVGFWDNDGNPATPSVPVRTYSTHQQGPDATTATPNGTGGFLPGVNNTPGPNGVVYDPASPWELASIVAQERDMAVHRESVEVNYTFDSGITFRSLSSNIVMDRKQVEGGDSRAYQSLTGFQLGPGMYTWSQEFNLISPEGNQVEWLVGLYKNHRHTELHLNIPLNGPCGWQYNGSWTPCPTALLPGVARLLWNSVDDVIHQAVYGQVNVHLGDKWELSMEARKNEDDNTQVRSTYVTAATTPGGANTVPCQGNIEGQIFYCPAPGYPPLTSGFTGWGPQPPFVAQDDVPTYKVGVNWQPVDGHFIYAFYARGYKAAQSIQTGFPLITEEIVDDIEIGWKGTLGRGLYAEFGIYDMSYEDMQLSVFQTSAVEGRQLTSNVGDSSIKGWEGSIRAVIGQLGVNASIAYSDSELADLTTVDTRALPPAGLGQPYPGDSSKGCTPTVATTGTCFDYTPYRLSLSGTESPFAPKVTYTLGLDYAFQLENGATLTPALSYNFSDSAYSSLLQSPNDNFFRTDERKLTNFSVTFEKDAWDIQFFATNATDRLFIEGVSGNSVLYGDPRVVGLRGSMTF
jgi:iron complex outermembrane receptor protein